MEQCKKYVLITDETEYFSYFINEKMMDVDLFFRKNENMNLIFRYVTNQLILK